jgi:hypothetical protein
MGWPSRLKKIIEVAGTVAGVAQIAGVPGASTVSDVVEGIHKDPGRPNEDADAVVAAAVDNHERRLLVIEKRLGIKGKP